MTPVAKLELTSVLIPLGALDAEATAPHAERPHSSDAACACESPAGCPVHDRVCPCSDRFGKCAKRCDHCLGFGIVNVQEATLPQCARCASLDSAQTQPFRGLGGIL